MGSTPKFEKETQTLETPRTDLQNIHSAELRHFEEEECPKLCSRKVELGILDAAQSEQANVYRMAGCIPSKDTDILSHMEPERVLEGLRYDAQYMVELEKLRQSGDRGLLACMVVRDKLRRSQAEIDCRLDLISKFTTACSNGAGEDLNIVKELPDALSKNAVDLMQADKALEEALGAYMAELKARPGLW